MGKNIYTSRSRYRISLTFKKPNFIPITLVNGVVLVIDLFLHTRSNIMMVYIYI